MKMSGKYQQPELVGNYVKFHFSLLDSIQIMKLKFLHFLFVEHNWMQDHKRIDSLIYELSPSPLQDNALSQTIYAPLREMVRHFDGYSHVNMENCPALELPSNTFTYAKDELTKKMTARHYSFWAHNNSFKIPQTWIDHHLSIHPPDLLEYTV